MVAEASRLLRVAPANAGSPETLPRLASLGFIYLYIGAPTRALEFYEEGAGAFRLLWHPSYASVRNTDDHTQRRPRPVLALQGLA